VKRKEREQLFGREANEYKARSVSNALSSSRDRERGFFPCEVKRGLLRSVGGEVALGFPAILMMSKFGLVYLGGAFRLLPTNEDALDSPNSLRSE